MSAFEEESRKGLKAGEKTSRKPRRKKGADASAGKRPERKPKGESRKPGRKTEAVPGGTPEGSAGQGPGEPAADLQTLLQNVWYEPGSKYPYVFRNSLGESGEFFCWGEREFCRHLRMFGVSTRIPAEGKQVSPADKIIADVQKKRTVHRSLLLAGYSEGVRTMNNQRILIRGGPRLPDPSPGEFGDLFRFIRQLFGATWQNGGKDDPFLNHQVQFFLFWLARRWRAIKEENPALFGQILFLIGAPSCGKSLLQAAVITPALGGRSYDPHLYISGEDKFSGGMFSAEHIAIEDPPLLGTEYKSRLVQQVRLKNLCTGTAKTRRAMNTDGETLSPVWAISYSANLEKIDSLPPFSEDFSDKAVLMKCFPTERPMGSGFWPWKSRIESQVPALLWHALETFGDGSNLLPELTETAGRFGARAWHHPDLLEELHEYSREEQLLQVIDMVFFTKAKEDLLPGAVVPPWKGSASAFRMELREAVAGNRGQEREAESLLKGGEKATGRYLATLARRYPQRIERAERKAGARGWIIHPPAVEPKKETGEE